MKKKQKRTKEARNTPFVDDDGLGWNPLREEYLHPGNRHLLQALPLWSIYLSGTLTKSPFNQTYHQSCPAYFQRCQYEWQRKLLNQHIVNVAFKSQKENQQIDAKIPQNFNHSVEYDLCVRGMNCFPYQAFGLTNSLDVWHHYASRDT